MTDIIDRSDPAHVTAQRLLDTRLIAWVTTLGGDGTPHAVPVWFQWHEGRIIVFSERTTAKVANIRRNPSVLVHLETGPFGSEVVILNGRAEISERDAASWLAEFRDAYQQKYADAITEFGASLDEIVAQYSTAIVVTPEKLLTW